ncbi:nuclear transport factor 2 family protein [Streptomyces collinus]|uniref:nuclear transport factor 2 family protein n=1 Tax=Streptomyces collinus TaxID=42684 RepID=UPI0036C3F581
MPADAAAARSWACRSPARGSAGIRRRRTGPRDREAALHFLGGHTADILGDRAITQTKMTISQRAEVDGVEVDVVCTGRFYDFCARHEGAWKIVRRQPIYEKDRLDVVDPAATLSLDPQLLGRFPVGYRHLGYLQTKAGFTVKTGLPGLAGEVVRRLYAEGAQWLDGSSSTPGAPH